MDRSLFGAHAVWLQGSGDETMWMFVHWFVSVDGAVVVNIKVFVSFCMG